MPTMIKSPLKYLQATIEPYSIIVAVPAVQGYLAASIQTQRLITATLQVKEG